MAGVTVVEDYNPPAGGVSVVEDVDGPPDGGVPAPMQEAYARVAELGAGMEDILPAPENLIGLTADALVSGVPKISQKVQQYLSSYQIPQGSPELNFGDLNDLVAGGRKRTLRDGDWQQRQQGAIDEQQFGPKYHNIADFERDVEEATTDKEREDALRRLARAKNENVWARDFRNAQEAKWKQREAELGRGRLSPEERYQQELYDFEMSQGPTARLWNSPPVRGLVSGINTIASTIVGSGADVLGAVGVDSASSFADRVREDMADDAEYNAIANINQGKVGSYTQQGVEMLTKYAPWGPAGRMLGEIAGVSNAMTAFIFGEARQSALQEAKKAGLKGGKAQAYAAAVGGANAAFTLIGGKAASKLGGKTTEQILSSLVNEGAAAAAASSTVKGRAKEIFKWAGTQIRDGGIEFGIEELPTAYAENLARYLAGMKDGVNPSAEEILDIFAMTMLMRGTAGGIDAASSLRDFSENPTQANATAANIPGKVAPTQADRERLAKIAGYLTGKMTIDTPAAPTAEGMEAGVEDFTARDRYKFAEGRRRANAPEEAARAAAEADRLAAERAAQMEAGVQPYSGPYYRPGQSGWGQDEDVAPTPGEAERMDRQSAATAAAMEAGVVSPYPPNIAEPEALSPEEREALAAGRPLPGKKRQGAAKVAKAEMQPGDLVRMRAGGYAEVQGTEGDWVDILGQDGTEYRVRRREIAQHWGPRSSEPSTGPETPPDASDQGPPPELPPDVPTQPEAAQEPTEAPQQNPLEQLSPEELGGVFGIDMEPAPEAPAKPAPKAVAVKVMMTQSDRQALRDLGWTQEQIRALTPQQGAEAIANSQSPPQTSVAPAEAPGAVPPAAPVTSGVAEPEKTAPQPPAPKKKPASQPKAEPKVPEPGKRGSSQWLVNAVLKEAERTGDKGMVEQAKALLGKRLSVDDKEMLEDYLSSSDPGTRMPDTAVASKAKPKKAKKAPEEPQTPQVEPEKPLLGMEDPDRVPTTDDHPLKGLGAPLRPIAPPELFQIAKEWLMGKIPMSNKRFRSTRGQVRFEEGQRDSLQILLNPKIAKDPNVLAAVLAHELGHVTDILPDVIINRGDLLARIASLNSHLKNADGTAIDLGFVGDKKALTEELQNLSKWWRGDWEGQKPGYQAYRRHSAELFADALSVLYTNPGALQKRAPLFFNTFLGYLGRKPEVLKTLIEVQHMLNSADGKLDSVRAKNIVDMFTDAQQAMQAGVNAQEHANASVAAQYRQFLDQHLLNTASPVSKKELAAVAQGAKVLDAEAARYAIDEMNYSNSANHLMFAAIQSQVHNKLGEAGLDEADVNEYLFLHRIFNERHELLNPMLFTAKEANEALEALRVRLGPEKFNALTGLMQKWHNIIYKRAEAAYKAGVISESMFKDTITKNKNFYSSFAVAHYLETNPRIPASIKRQVGTTETILSPYLATHMKFAAINRLTERNIAVTKVRKMLQKFYREDITQVPIPRGMSEPGKNPRPGFEYLTELVDGKPVAWEVPSNIAKAFMRHDIGSLTIAANFVQSKFYQYLHPLYVTLNPAFAVRNLPRDFSRTAVNLREIGRKLAKKKLGELTEANKDKIASLQKDAKSGKRGAKEALAKLQADIKKKANEQRITIRQVFEAYGMNWDVAKGRARGELGNKIRTMIEQKILDTPYSHADAATLSDEGATSWIMAQYGIGEPKKTGIKKLVDKAPGVIKKPLQWIGGNAEYASVLTETLPKVAAFDLLRKRGVPEHERAMIIRKYVGTPDYMQRGLWTSMTNSIRPYSKVAWNGLDWDADVAFGHRSGMDKAGAGYWFDRAMMIVLPALAKKAAVLGLLGAGLKKAYEMIPQHYIDNYIIIPLGFSGEDDDKKAVFINVPIDDTGRLMSALTSKLIDVAAESMGYDTRKGTAKDALQETVDEIFTNTSGTLNPAANMLWTWFQYGVQGMNPRDPFYGTDIIPRRNWDAGGWDATKPMVSWTLDQFGVASSIIRGATGPTIGSPFESDPDTPMQATARVGMGMLGVLKMTNRGLTENEYEEINGEEAEAAHQGLKLSDRVRSATKTLNRLQRLENLSPEKEDQRLLLSKWYNKAYKPMIQEIKGAETEEEKEAIRKQLDLFTKDLHGRYMKDVAADMLEKGTLGMGKPEKEEPGRTLEETVAAYEAERAAAKKWIIDHVSHPKVQEAIAELPQNPSYQNALKSTRRPIRGRTERIGEYNARVKRYFERLQRKADILRESKSLKQ